MPELNIQPESTDSILSGLQPDNIDNPISDDTDVSIDITPLVESSTSLSSEELRDPNNIVVTISDKEAPIVILFGPPACGKTMTLVRLARYLGQIQYKIEPVTDFRPTHDKNYEAMCKSFNDMVGSDDAAQSTANINFMLVKIHDRNGKTLCQILEGPGEYYFNPDNPHADFPRYVSAIINRPNRKIWAIMVEPDKTTKMNSENRRHYAAKIGQLKKRIKPRDRVLFIFNKIDQTPYVINGSSINYSSARKHVSDIYPGIFAPFKNLNPITKWWAPYRFDFVAFQTGDYPEKSDGSLGFEQGDDDYPRRLWNIIRKRIFG